MPAKKKITSTSSRRGRPPAQKPAVETNDQPLPDDDPYAISYGSEDYEGLSEELPDLRVGITVHYVESGPLKEDGQCSPAVVVYVKPTDEEEPLASLFAMNRRGANPVEDIMHSAGNEPRTWHYENECHHLFPDLQSDVLEFNTEDFEESTDDMLPELPQEEVIE